MNATLARAALLLALPAALLAQPRHGERSHRREQPRVYLYEHADFRGGVIVLRAGEFAENLARIDFDNGRRANDRISSIRIEGDVEVTLHIHAGFHGEALRVDRDIRDLGARPHGHLGFNNRISSVRVGAARDDRRPDRGPGRNLPAAIDYDGIIRRAYQDILERDPDERGLRHYRVMMIDRRWSEADVREDIRRSDEFRLVAERMVIRVYRDLLRRDPDAGGLATYRRLVIEQRWTEDQLRADIKRSAEYRNRPVQPPAPKSPSAEPRRENPRRAQEEEKEQSVPDSK